MLCTLFEFRLAQQQQNIHSLQSAKEGLITNVIGNVDVT
jgi:hypothetical protein